MALVSLNSQSLTKRSADTSLMPPPPRPKRIKRPATVIDEDSYTDALSHIIARDFFPGLIETESKQEYLDALESKDQEWISAAGRKLSEVMTLQPDGRRNRGRRGTSMTPTNTYGRNGEDTPTAWQGDTPMSVKSSASNNSTAAKSGKAEVVDTNLSLSAFQAKYTSEDNESFYKLLDKQNLKKAEKYSWMWQGNKILAPRQIAHRKREERLLAAKSEQESSDTKEVLFIEPADDRPAMPDSWPSGPENSLMFDPTSSIEGTSMQTIQQTAEATSRAPLKSVVYDNTRLHSSSTSRTSISRPPSPTHSAVHAALSGHPRPSASSSSSTSSFINGSSTPRVAGYSFVDPDPKPAPPPPPSSYTPIPASLLGSGDSSPNPFNIRESGRRETLHLKMVDRMAKGKRTASRKEVAGASPMVPRFASSPRIGLGGLTPAGQKLAGKMGNMTPKRMGFGGGSITPKGGQIGGVVRRSGLRQETSG